MWVQKIPEFHSGHILKREMMAELSAYLYRLGPLLYQNCADGIVSVSPEPLQSLCVVNRLAMTLVLEMILRLLYASSPSPVAESIAAFVAQTLSELGRLPDHEGAVRAATGGEPRRRPLFGSRWGAR